MIVALDPGRTTGVAWCFDRVPSYGIDQFVADEVWSFLNINLRAGMSRLIVERFKPRPNMFAVDLTPVEVIGVVKEWCRQNWRGPEVVWQDPAEAKFQFNSERLKAMGVYETGKPHGLDALRHILYYQKAFVKGKTRAR